MLKGNEIERVDEYTYLGKKDVLSREYSKGTTGEEEKSMEGISVVKGNI